MSFFRQPPPAKQPEAYPAIISKHFGEEYLKTAGRTDESFLKIMNTFFKVMAAVCIAAIVVIVIFYEIKKIPSE